MFGWVASAHTTCHVCINRRDAARHCVERWNHARSGLLRTIVVRFCILVMVRLEPSSTRCFVSELRSSAAPLAFGQALIEDRVFLPFVIPQFATWCIDIDPVLLHSSQLQPAAGASTRASSELAENFEAVRKDSAHGSTLNQCLPPNNVGHAFIVLPRPRNGPHPSVW